MIISHSTHVRYHGLWRNAHLIDINPGQNEVSCWFWTNEELESGKIYRLRIRGHTWTLITNNDAILVKCTWNTLGSTCISIIISSLHCM